MTWQTINAIPLWQVAAGGVATGAGVGLLGGPFAEVSVPAGALVGGGSAVGIALLAQEANNWWGSGVALSEQQTSQSQQLTLQAQQEIARINAIGTVGKTNPALAAQIANTSAPPSTPAAQAAGTAPNSQSPTGDLLTEIKGVAPYVLALGALLLIYTVTKGSFGAGK